MFPADLIEYFFIDRLPIYRLARSFKFFYYRLHHLPFNLLILCYALASFAESTQILIDSHYEPPVLLSIITHENN